MHAKNSVARVNTLFNIFLIVLFVTKLAIFAKFAVMKRVLFILAFLISLLFKGGDVLPDVQNPLVSDVVSVCDSGENFCEPGTSAYSAETHNFTTSYRNSGQGRRVSSSIRSCTRIVKDGKIIDKFNFSTFRKHYIEFYSGMYSSVRYIYSIRHLLI